MRCAPVYTEALPEYLGFGRKGVAAAGVQLISTSVMMRLILLVLVMFEKITLRPRNPKLLADIAYTHSSLVNGI